MKTQQQIEAFDTQQRRNDTHPLACPNPHVGNWHRNLKLREDGCLYCAECNYAQDYPPATVPPIARLPTKLLPNTKRNHVIGVLRFEGSCALISDAIGTDLRLSRIFTPALDKYTDKELFKKIRQFDFCPDCGAKIDWDKIHRDII